MRFTTALALLVPALAVLAAPLPSKRAAFSFALQRSVSPAQSAYRCIDVHPSYDQFQISDGVAGNAEAEANAVFVGAFPILRLPSSFRGLIRHLACRPLPG